MAIVKFRPPVVDMRGVSNGIIYSYCGLTHTATVKPPPRPRKKTARTEENTSAFGTLSKMWYGQLTPEQRAAWEAFAKRARRSIYTARTLELTTPEFGRTANLTDGYSCFIRINARLLRAGYSIILLPPPRYSPYVRTSLLTPTILYEPYRIKIEWIETPTPVPVTNYKVLIYIRKLPHRTWYRMAVIPGGIGEYIFTEYRASNGVNLSITKGAYQIKVMTVTLQGEAFIPLSLLYVNIQ